MVGAAILLGTAALPVQASENAGGPPAGESGGFTLDPASRLLAGNVPAGASVADIARRIAELAGIELEIRGDPGSLRHSVSLDGLAIEAALKRIAPDASLVVAYLPRGASSESVTSGFAGRALIQSIVLGSGAPVEPPSDPVPAAPAETPDPDVARAIAQREIIALSYAADRASIDKLREAAVESELPAARRAAMSALAGIAGRESLGVFTGSGLNDADPGVRIEGARSIMRLMGERGRTIVDAAARRERDPAVRETMQRLARGETVDRPTARLEARLVR